MQHKLESGISDKEVIQLASKNNLIILTCNRHHGEPIFKYALSNPPAVTRFRKKANAPSSKTLKGSYRIRNGTETVSVASFMTCIQP